MSILASLARVYERLPGAPRFGYSMEKIGFVISLNGDGSVANVSDLRSGDGKKKLPRMMLVPQPVKRTVGIAPNFLWDKTSYVLGVSGKDSKRVREEHAAFLKRHLDALAGSEDEGLSALRAFLTNWSATEFAGPLWPDDLKDQNAVFALESERRRDIYLHDRLAAQALWSKMNAEGNSTSAVCLVSGVTAPVARLHPAIKGVWGAQSSGASIVSFNLDAFTSYGHEQGDNAPVSEHAAFAYTTALNRFLERDSGHRIQIGDASTVFWADASEADAAAEAEAMFAGMAGLPIDEKMQAALIGDKLDKIRKGLPLKEIAPQLATGVRFHVLGLSPNAARLSIRFYYEDDFGALTRNYQVYAQDMSFEPWRAGKARPSIATCVLRTAPASVRNNQISFDRDHISPLLSGEILRSVLTGTRFPGSLLSLLLTRIRSDHILDSVRVSMVKALLVRDMRLAGRLPHNADQTPQEDYLVRSDPDDPNPARRLGRLFAVLERAQLAALGDNLNATIKDKFLGAAAATPGRVFAGLIKLSNHHTKRLRNGHSDAEWIKDPQHAHRVGASLEHDIGELWGSFLDGAPAQHSQEEQGLFLVGYYQERFGRRRANPADDAPDASDEMTGDNEDGQK